MCRKAADNEATVVELPVTTRIATLETQIAELEERIEELSEENRGLERVLDEAEGAAETIEHVIAFIRDLDQLLGIPLLPIRLQLALEELCERTGVQRPWVGRPLSYLTDNP